MDKPDGSPVLKNHNMVPWVNTHGERFVAEGALLSCWLSGPSYWAVWSEDLVKKERGGREKLIDEEAVNQKKEASYTHVKYRTLHKG